MSDPIIFAGSPLDRESLRRRDRSWLSARAEDPESRFLPVWKLEALVKKGEHASLAWARTEFFADLDPRPEPVLLGTAEGVAHFAVDVSAVDDPASAFGVEEVARFEELRAAAARLSGNDIAIAGQARTLVDWHARHRFCAACGGGTRSVLGGAQRRCTECEADHFPRTDPVAIAVVGRGDRCLLGRSPGWPRQMFSALAGFVEAAESVEEAVRREILEESGIRVGAVRYHASQPWPFPSSLMIGCHGQAESREIRIDPEEMADVR